eukprot:13415566-Ditylum_brightwellii.AAC.1
MYLASYYDFHIGGVGNSMLTREFDVFSATKGIWQIETSKTQVVKAMHHVTELLEKYKDKCPDDEKERDPAFLYPRVLNTYDVPATYAKTLIPNVKLLI